MNSSSVTFSSAVHNQIAKAVAPSSQSGTVISATEVKSILKAAPNAQRRRLIAASLLNDQKYNLTKSAIALLVEELRPSKKDMAKTTVGPVSQTDIRSVADARDAKTAAVEDLMSDGNVRRALMDPSMLRSEAYQKYVNNIRNTTLYRTYHKDVRASLTHQVSQVISETEIKGTVIDETNFGDVHLHQFTRKLYDLVQETARSAGVIGYEGGPQSVELKILSDNSPNAYVYGFDDGHPRVHVIDTIVDVFFDNDKEDWVCEEAKLMLQSVIAHELGHVKDSPAEWNSWFSILLNASGLMEDHTDGPLFTARQKNAMISKARTMASSEKMTATGGAKSAGLVSGFFQFAADERLAGTINRIGDKLDIPAEKATAALVEALGIDFDAPQFKNIERDESGKPTKFGIGQAVFQSSWELSRAGEIVADRFAYLVQGTNKWTAFIDMMLGTAVNFNLFGDSAKEKHDFMDRLLRKGYGDWVYKQIKTMNERAESFNLTGQKELLECVSHPPTLPRIVLGTQYMDRFSNPDAYPHLVARMNEIQDPTQKTLELIRALHHGMHEEITRFVDPRGFDKADATARVMHGFMYSDENDNWKNAMDVALKVFDDLVPDAELTKGDSSVFEIVCDAIDVKKGKCAIPAWAETPMDNLTQHIIERLEGLKQTNLGADAKGVLASNLEEMWGLHKEQLKKREAFFKEPTPSTAEKLAKLLKEVAKDDGAKGGGSEN